MKDRTTWMTDSGNVTQVRQERLRWVDSLKGVAILVVVCAHCGGDGLPKAIAHGFAMGAEWVQLFLLLSGMLVYASFDRMARDPAGLSWRSVGIWMFRRIFRLVPLYWLALAVNIVLGSGSAFWLGAEGHVTAWNVLAHVFLAHGFFPHYVDSIIGVEWYVAVLVQYYLLMPVLYKLLNTAPRALLTAIGSIVAGFALIKFSCGRLDPCLPDYELMRYYFSMFWVVKSLPALFLGAVLQHAVVKMPSWAPTERRIMALSLLLAFGMLYLGLSIERNALYLFLPSWIFAVCFSLLVLALSLWPLKLVDNPLCAFLGQNSYGIFLFHMLLIRPMPGNGPGWWMVRFALCVAMATVASWLAERLVDRPLQRLLHLRWSWPAVLGGRSQQGL